MSRNTVAGTSERKSEQDALGRYYTPDAVTLALLTRWRSVVAGRRVVDPFAGGGSWLRAALAVGAASVGGCDMDPAAPTVLDGRAVLGDGFEYVATLNGGEVVATNPPFSEFNRAQKAILSAWYEGRVSAVILLGRLTMLEGLGRRTLYRQWMPCEGVTSGRRLRWEGPGGDALADGNDNYGSAVLLWRDRGARGCLVTPCWEPDDEAVDRGVAQVGLFGGAR